MLKLVPKPAQKLVPKPVPLLAQKQLLLLPLLLNKQTHSFA